MENFGNEKEKKIGTIEKEIGFCAALLGNLVFDVTLLARINAAELENTNKEVSVLLNTVTKANAKEIIPNLQINSQQQAALIEGLKRATNNERITIEQLKDGEIILKISRPGYNGYQVIEKRIASDGATKSVVQKAYDRNGIQVHNDDKTEKKQQ